MERGEGMESVIREIKKIRQGIQFSVDLSNANRYRVVALEKDGSKRPIISRSRYMEMTKNF